MRGQDTRVSPRACDYDRKDQHGASYHLLEKSIYTRDVQPGRKYDQEHNAEHYARQTADAAADCSAADDGRSD
jgi:hypothetical protein